MNKHLISVITAVVLSTLTLTAYAWTPPSEGCLTVRNELGEALDALQACKESSEKSECLADTRARFHACVDLALKRERGGICPDGDASEQPDKEALCFGDDSGTPSCSSAVGNWSIVMRNCDSGTPISSFNWDLFPDFTSAWGAISGVWSQDACSLEFSFLIFGVTSTYIGTMSGDAMEGTFSSTDGNSGCWTAGYISDPNL